MLKSTLPLSSYYLYLNNGGMEGFTNSALVLVFIWMKMLTANTGKEEEHCKSRGFTKTSYGIREGDLG